MITERRVINKLIDKIKLYLENHFKGLNIAPFFLLGFFVVYGMINISEILWIKIIMGIGGLNAEWENLKFWGLSHVTIDGKKPYLWLRVICIWYVLVLALPSGVGFVATEVKLQEKQEEKIIKIETNNQKRITQLFGLIDQLTLQMEREGRTLARIKYDKLDAQKVAYETELKDRLAGKYTIPQTETKVQMKDMFANVSEILWGFPKHAILLLMFGSMLAMGYIDLALSPVQVKLKTQSFTHYKPPPAKNKEELESDLEVTPKLSEDDPRKFIYDPEDSYKSEFIQFVDRLYDCRDPFVRLNSIENMSEFPFSKKQRFKNELLQMGAIQIGQGKIASLWPKEEVVKNIRYVKRET